MPFLHRFAKLPRQEHAFGDDLWLSCVRVIEHGVCGRLHNVNGIDGGTIVIVSVATIGIMIGRFARPEVVIATLQPE